MENEETERWVDPAWCAAKDLLDMAERMKQQALRFEQMAKEIYSWLGGRKEERDGAEKSSSGGGGGVNQGGERRVSLGAKECGD